MHNLLSCPANYFVRGTNAVLHISEEEAAFKRQLLGLRLGAPPQTTERGGCRFADTIEWVVV